MSRHAGDDEAGHMLALDVHAARRDMGLTTAVLAARTGLDAATLQRIEGGDLVPSEAAIAVCQALGIPAVRHVPGIAPPRDLTASVPDQAPVVQVLRGLPDEPGSFVVSDVAAEDAASGRTATTWADQERRRDKAAFKVEWGELAFLIAAFPILGLVVLFSLVLLLEVLSSLRGWHPDHAWGPKVIASLLPFSFIGFLCCRRLMRWRNSPELNRLLATGGLPDLRDLAIHQGYVISPGGLSVVECRAGTVTRTDVPVHTMSDVVLTEHGTTHLGVTVVTAKGTTVLSWIPRTRVMADVVHGWRNAVASRSTSGVPYRLDVPSAAIREGAQ